MIEKMKDINSKVDALNGGPSHRKGMKRLLVMIFVMTCGIILALKSVDTSNGFLFCRGKGASAVYGRIFFTPGSEPDSDNTGKILGAVDIEEAAVVDAKERNSSIVNVRNNIATNADSVKAVCDYTMGKWVKDKSRPFYSGDTCKQWLSEMWACKLMMGRPDFDYENYRWQPDACDLPTFDGPSFLSRMRNKVVAFVGDSIGRQQYQSIMCLITGGKDDILVEDVSKSFGFVKPRGAIRAEGTAQRFMETNTTVLYYWSASLCEIEPLNKTDRDTEFAMHLDRPAAFLQKYIEKIDVLILNTGHHWNRGKIRGNKWVMHVNGKPNTDVSLNNVGAAYNFTVHKVITWLHQKLENNGTMAQIYMRSLSPRHFFNGDWDSGGRCDDNTVPVEERNITGRMTRDLVAESAVLGTRVHLLNVTYLSQFRDEAHISKYRPKQVGQDCLHWCLPGIPDVWNEVLYAEMFYGNSLERNSTPLVK